MYVENVPVPGGELRLARFGSGPRLIIAVHGITASLMAWAAVGEALPEGWTLAAMDLRGRGHSRDVPGPFGLQAHADDVGRVAEHLGADETTVLTGHSMGAYVAVLQSVQRTYAKTVLVDGGLPLPLPPGLDVDQTLEATLGPALTRLSQIFPDEDSYVAFFQQHPALQDWSPAVDRYVRYDVLPVESGVRSRAVEKAVRADGRWLLSETAAISAALHAIGHPLSLIRAPRGLLNQEVGLLPDPLAEAWRAELPALADEVVPDCNHYTIAFDPRCVRVLVERLTDIRQ
ncbi:alpha/beta hydrolase [Herbidospora yilanensis]|uniref:alpha/beta hydrolase n=1 Tax=Herbidospora yilanensis TaxID=354426 RepID=UPI000781B404|nr:alpha/beta hydrolase [Herbidospora yilanensis]